MKIKYSASDAIFTAVNYIMAFTIFIIILYPLIYVTSASFSNPRAVISGRVWLFPVEPTLIGYKTIFENPHIITGYGNSLFYTVFGTLINVFMTVLAAYPLSRKEFKAKNIVTGLFVFTMLFSGGLIPTYLLVRNLHMVDTRLALMIPNAMAIWNVVIARTYFQTSIPEQLHESAEIDGCSEFKFMLSILLPLSGPIIAVTALYYAVGHWNSYFDALIYLKTQKLYPLQIILREILILNTMSVEMTMSADELLRRQGLQDLVKYSLIIVACIPILLLYPFIQKYFIKGVMIGSLKG